MKKSSKLIIGIIIALSFAIGFIVGVILNIPPQKESDLAGTIGKINNYRNVKISDGDIKLRSDLMKDEKLLKKYKDYYNFQYASSAKLGISVDNALEASAKDKEFSSTYQKEVIALTNFKNFLKEARKDLLIALSVLNNIYESDQVSISSLINNANNAVAQIRYREAVVGDFVFAIEIYLSKNKVKEYTQLKKAHDMLLLNQFSNALITQNKPMLKFLDKKEFFATAKELKNESSIETAKLTAFISNDGESLNLTDNTVFNTDNTDFNNFVYTDLSSLINDNTALNTDNTVLNTDNIQFNSDNINFTLNSISEWVNDISGLNTDTEFNSDNTGLNTDVTNQNN